MGMIENARNAKRLQEAADKLRRGDYTFLEKLGLTAPEGAVIVYLFAGFKHHEAAQQVSTWFKGKQARDATFAADADAYAIAMESVAESDFKTIKRPEAQSALAKFAAA